MNKIEQSLEKLFEKHRLIFWYDDGGAMREEYEALTLDDVVKLEIKNNEFGIKVKILSGDKETKYLIYSEHKQPKNEENWLLDLNLASYLYSADKVAMWIEELGVDRSMRETIGRHEKFFVSSVRVEKLRTHIDPKSGDDELCLGMCAVVCGCEPKIESITLKLLSYLADENDTKSDELQKYALDGFLYSQWKRRYGYINDVPSVKDFTYSLLLSSFYSDTNPSKKSLNQEANHFVKHAWMDSSKNKASYEKLSIQVESAMSIATELDGMPVDTLIGCDTFVAIEQMILQTVFSFVLAGTIKSQKIEEICKVRKAKSFWFDRYEDMYLAVLNASKLLDAISESNFEQKSAKAYFDRYASEWYEIDSFYRKALLHGGRQSNDKLKSVMEVVENGYINSFLMPLNDGWQKEIEKLDRWDIEDIYSQGSFFDRVVVPNITNDRKLYVIISDAMRFECAKELSDRLIGKNRNQCQLEAVLGVIPSYTQLGIASLLPHKELSFADESDTVLVDGKSSAGVENRNKILDSSTTKAVFIKDEDFLEFSREAGREFVKNYSLIYIYHNTIDATGDKAATESGVFEAVERSFGEIEKILTQITNFNGTNAVITADHGFLYQNSEVEESELCQISKDGAFKYNRRFVLGSGMQKSDCVHSWSFDALGIRGNGEALIPKSINKLRMQGAGNRFVHGGASLQEVVVPVLFYGKKRKDDVAMVDVAIVKTFDKISSNQITIALWQNEPTSDKILPRTVLVGFYSDDEQLLSNEEKIIFDISEDDARNREQKIRFTFGKNIDKHSGRQIFLTLTEIESGTSIRKIYKKEPYSVFISFVNDFDEF